MSFSMRFPGHETVLFGNRIRVNDASLSTLKDFVGEAINLRLKPLYGLNPYDSISYYVACVVHRESLVYPG